MNVWTARNTRDLAVDDKFHPNARMTAASNEEVDIRLCDLKFGGRQFADGRVAFEKGVDEPFSEITGNVHLSFERTLRRSFSESFSFCRPVAVIGAFEVGEDDVAFSGGCWSRRSDAKGQSAKYAERGRCDFM